MASLCTEADDRLADFDVDSFLSRMQSRPLTFSRKKSLLQAPEFLKRLTGEETVKEGEELRLELEVTGMPTPVLRWYKDDEEIFDHPRINVSSSGDGTYVFSICRITKGDEAAYRCRATNDEGSTSCTFFLTVKAKPRKKRSSRSCKRTVSFPPMFPTIIEKVEEEEKAAKETAKLPPSPLTELYDGLTLKQRHTWPRFLGDWAFVDGGPNQGGSTGSEDDIEFIDSNADTTDNDDVFSSDVASDVVTPAFYLDVGNKPADVKDKEQTTLLKKEENNNNKQQDSAIQKVKTDNKINKENAKDISNLTAEKKQVDSLDVKLPVENKTSKSQTSSGVKIIQKTNDDGQKPKAEEEVSLKRENDQNKQNAVLKCLEGGAKLSTKENKDTLMISKTGDVEKVNSVKTLEKKEKEPSKEAAVVETKEADKTSRVRETKELFIKPTKPGEISEKSKTSDTENVKQRVFKPVETKDECDAKISHGDEAKKLKTATVERKIPSSDVTAEQTKQTEVEKVKLKTSKTLTKDEKPGSDNEKPNEVDKIKLKSVTISKKKEETGPIKKSNMAEKVNLKTTKLSGKKDVKDFKSEEFRKVKLQSVKNAEKVNEMNPHLNGTPKEFEKVSLKSVKSVETKGDRVNLKSEKQDKKTEEIKKLKLKSANGSEKKQTGYSEKTKTGEKVTLLSPEQKPDDVRGVKLRSTKNVKDSVNGKISVKSTIASELKIKLKTVSKDLKPANETSETSKSEEAVRIKHRRASEPRINKIDYMKQVFENKVDKWRSRSAERPRTVTRSAEKQNLTTDDVTRSEISIETKNNKSSMKTKLTVEKEISHVSTKSSSFKENKLSSSSVVARIQETSASEKVVKQTELKENIKKEARDVNIKTISNQTVSVKTETNESVSETAEKTFRTITKFNTAVKKQIVPQASREVTQSNKTEEKQVTTQFQVSQNVTKQREATQTISEKLVKDQNKMNQREETQITSEKVTKDQSKLARTELKTSRQSGETVTKSGQTKITVTRKVVTESSAVKQTIRTVETKKVVSPQQKEEFTSKKDIKDTGSVCVQLKTTEKEPEPEKIKIVSIKPRPGQEYLNVRKQILKNADFPANPNKTESENVVALDTCSATVDTNKCSSSVSTNHVTTASSGIPTNTSDSLSRARSVEHAEDKNKLSHKSPPSCLENKATPTGRETSSVQKFKEMHLTRSDIFHLLESRRESSEKNENLRKGAVGHCNDEHNCDVIAHTSCRDNKDSWADNPIKTEIRNKINEQIELRNSPKTNRKHKSSPKKKNSDQTKIVESSQPNIRSPITFSNCIARRHGSDSTSKVDVPVVKPAVSIRRRLQLFPFRRKFNVEDFVFLLSLLTFSALLTGMPSLTFVLLVLSVEILYVLIFAVDDSD